MSLQISAFLRLLLPFTLLALAVWARPYLIRLNSEQLMLAAYLPYFLAALNMVLAHQFNRSRFVLLAIGTATCFWLIQSSLQVSLATVAARDAYVALGFGVPLAVLFLLLVPERGIWNRYGALYALTLVCIALLAPTFDEAMVTALAEYPQWLQVWPTESFVMPLAVVATFCGVGVVGLAMFLWRTTDVEIALLVSLAAAFVVMGWLHLAHISLLLFNVAAVLQLLSILRSSHAMAYRDDLTGLLGRRALNERLRGIGPRYCLAMLDIDHFKKFNDTYGHDVGDDVLKLVATRIAGVRGGGTAFRYGGEEFCVIFPRRAAEECIAALEAVRESVAGYQMTLRDTGHRPVQSKQGARQRGRMATRIRSGEVNVTISIGLAERTEEHAGSEAVIKAADQQLYRAKQAGRNRICY